MLWENCSYSLRNAVFVCCKSICFTGEEFLFYFFYGQIAPWASCIVNGIFWDVNHPRFLSNMDTKQLLSGDNSPKADTSPGCPRLPHRLLAISDITADPGGSIEFITDCTSIEAPFALYDADHKHQHFKNLRSVTMDTNELKCGFHGYP